MTPSSARSLQRLQVAANGLDRQRLLELLRADQWRRWQQRRPLLVEFYRDALPDLLADPELLFRLVCGEILLREERDEVPTFEEYRQRFPNLTPQLERFFGVKIAALFQFRSSLDQVCQEASIGSETLAAADAPGHNGTNVPRRDAISPPVAVEPESINTVVPGYELLGKLGQGGMGVVYKAQDLKLGRTVALKMVLHGEHADEPELVRFLTEAEAVAQLQHAKVVRLYESGRHNSLPYFTLEFIDGGTLADRLRDHPLSARDAARLVEQIAHGVQHAHERGILHRDLKPGNVLLTSDGTPRVSDFGLAKRLDVGTALTATGNIMGTPSYMAPEQARGDAKRVGPTADVYALGAILYECLTGRPPFRAATLAETLFQVMGDEPVPVRNLVPKCPRDLETICYKCLQKIPERRYASAQELADDLRRFQTGEPIRARPVGMVERAVKWAKRRPTAAALTVVSVVGLLAFLVGGLWFNARVVEHRNEAVKAREFLVSIFQKAETDVKGANVTVRQLLDEAETRIPVEFAEQPDLREEMVAALGKVRRGIGRRTPQAMILEARGTVQLQSAVGVQKPAVPQTLVNLDDRLSLSTDAHVQLVFLSDFHKERVKPGREVTIDFRGCEPAEAVLERDDSVLMTFVRLPKGTFYMGWDGDKKGVKTEIKEDFEIAVHDVTQGQWEAVMGNNPSWFSRKGNGRNNVVDISDEELKLFPVENVPWDDALEFIKKLNEKERERGYLYRLPIEAEWEYACRGGATSEEECSFHFYFDKPTNNLSSEQANFNGNYPFGKVPKGKYLARPTRVGAYPSNKLGLCDMHGNVYQWSATSEDSYRLYRGGCWYSLGDFCQAAKRFYYAPTERVLDIGFRLARVPRPAAGQ